MIKYLSLCIVICISFSGFTQQVDRIVKGNTEFAFDLYKSLAASEKGENVFFSPYSISQAMAITLLGSRNKTAKEIATVLHFPESEAELQKSFSRLHRKLNKNCDSIIFKSANSLWAQKGYAFKDEFISSANDHYNAPCKYLNYKKKGSRKKAVGAINKWTLDNTNKQVGNFINQNDLNKDTRLLMVNAVWFKGDWAAGFNENRTHKGSFYAPKGEQQVLFMQNKAKYWYYDDDMIQVLRISYKGQKQSLLIFLPIEQNGLGKFEQNFDDYYFRNILKDMNKVKIDIRIPKFEIEQAINLNEVLKEMGIEQAFTNNANFSGMAEKNNLKIDKILHKAKIEVNEKGVEASAASAISMMRKSANLNTRTFNANHPFVYIIRDEVTGTILFFGRFTQNTPKN